MSNYLITRTDQKSTAVQLHVQDYWPPTWTPLEAVGTADSLEDNVALATLKALRHEPQADQFAISVDLRPIKWVNAPEIKPVEGKIVTVAQAVAQGVYPLYLNIPGVAVYTVTNITGKPGYFMLETTVGSFGAADVTQLVRKDADQAEMNDQRYLQDIQAGFTIALENATDEWCAAALRMEAAGLLERYIYTPKGWDPVLTGIPCGPSITAPQTRFRLTAAGQTRLSTK